MTKLMFPHNVPPVEPAEGSIIIVCGSFASGAGYSDHMRVRVGDQWRPRPDAEFESLSWRELTDLELINEGIESPSRQVQAVNVQVILDATPTHQWTSTIKRPDGLVVTATIELPEGHPGIKPEPRPWNPEGDWTVKEMSEIAFMSVQAVHSTVERNFRSRDHYRRQDHYWTQNLEVPTEAIEAAKG